MNLKTLTKIKLINWHIFTDDLININQNTLIFGENGSGKSTLIDAIHYVISGGSAKFNTAANDNTKRTIDGYVRGKTGVEGKEFLRPQPNVIAHIALEFYDDIERKNFIIGSVLEIRDSSNKTYPIFYHVLDEKLFNEPFFTIENGSRKVLNYQRLKLGFEDNDKVINRLDGSKAKIRYDISQILGIESKKYYELLPKALAFKPIDEVSKFVYDFLMPEDNVNIERMKKDIQTYRSVAKEIERDEEKLSHLNKLYQLYFDTKKIQKDNNILEVVKVHLIIKDLIKSIERYQNKIDENKKKEEAFDKRIKETEKTKEQLLRKIYEIENSKEYKLVKEIERDIKIQKDKVLESNKKVIALNNYILQEQKLIAVLKLNYRLNEYIKSENFDVFKDELKTYKVDLDKETTKIHKESSAIESESKKTRDLKTVLNNELEKINKGIRIYPDSVENLREAIKVDVKNQHLVDIDVKPFCECVEVLDETWRNALEGYLNTRRFDLFVDEKYHDTALRSYEKYKKEKNIFGVGLVNTAKLNNYDVEENAIYHKLKIEKNEVKKYAAMTLGGMICVDHVDDLKKYESAITKTVMVYKNKASRQTKKDIWENPYLGNQSLKLRKQAIEKELLSIGEQLEKLKEEKEKYEKLIKTIGESKVSNLLAIENVWYEYDKETNHLERLEMDKKSLSDDSLLTSVDMLQKYNERILGNKELEDEIREGIKTLNEETGRIKGNLEECNIKMPEEQNKLAQLTHNNPELKVDFEDFISNKEERDLKDSVKIIESNKTLIAKNEKQMVADQTKYIEKFGFDSNSTIEYIKDFIVEYEKIKFRELVTYREQAKTALEECNKTFQEDFITKIRQKIRTERKNINKLNEVLRTKPFGSDEEIYRFVIGKSKEKEFADYYDIFDSDQEFNITDLITPQLTDKNRELMKELFERLTKDDSSESQEKYLQEYTDYRRFMSYDIKITNKNGDVIYFSKTNKEKSGGEIQTPFYVIIAASFEQLMKNTELNRSSACIVILDEAFNNMDESRIEAIMSFYVQLKIQLFIVVTPQRASTILPYVQTNIGLHKKNHRAIVVQANLEGN